jgi:putative colanic acid biosynthesis acetyltransferase WcaF
MSNKQEELIFDMSNFENWLSWKNKLARQTWIIVSFFLFKPFVFRIFNPWRNFLLRCFGANLHSKAIIYSSVKIWAPWNLTMDAYACLGPNVNCYNTGHIYIGKSSWISQGVYLCPGSHDIENPKFPMVPSDMHIEDQVWIATDAFIGPKVTIGQGAVVGARAAVFKNVEPWTVVGGNPAKPLKKRIVKKQKGIS